MSKRKKDILSIKDDVEFLEAYIKELQEIYVLVSESGPSNCSPPSDYDLPTTDKKAERAACLADEYGLNGDVFRNSLPEAFDGFGDWLASQQRKLKKQIKLLSRIIAKIEKSDEKGQKVSLTDNELQLLYDMADQKNQCRHRSEIYATTNIAESTLKTILKDFEKKGWIHRPKGPRSGYTITLEGIRIYEIISTD